MYPEKFTPWFTLATTATGTGTGGPLRDEGGGETTDMMRRRMRMEKVGRDAVRQRSLHFISTAALSTKPWQRRW